MSMNIYPPLKIEVIDFAGSNVKPVPKRKRNKNGKFVKRESEQESKPEPETLKRPHRRPSRYRTGG